MPLKIVKKAKDKNRVAVATKYGYVYWKELKK